MTEEKKEEVENAIIAGRQTGKTLSPVKPDNPDDCQVCGERAQVGVIGLGTWDHYCNSCYNQKYKSRGRKVN